MKGTVRNEEFKNSDQILGWAKAVKTLAVNLQKDVILVLDGALMLGYTGEGRPLDVSMSKLQVMNQSQGQIEWEGKRYYYQRFEVKSLSLDSQLFILSSQSYSALPFLEEMRSKILDKISLNLLWTTFIGLGITFFLLGQLSKKMTKPIVQMAKAAEEIGKGNYEPKDLPQVGERKDEAAILAKSFDQMRMGLQEREKIRGVLKQFRTL